MKQITDNWTKEEFKAFLMLYIAKADLQVNNDELFVITASVTEDAFQRIEMIQSKCNDIQCINLIKEQKEKHYPGEEGKEYLLDEITKLALADDNFSVYEKNLIRSLKRLL